MDNSGATIASAGIKRASSQDALLDRVLGCLKVSEGEKIPILKEDLREAQLALVELRDRIIGDMRSPAGQAGAAVSAGSATRAWIRSKLDRVNVSLSLLTGVEYPVQAVDRDKIRQAEGVLKSIQTE